MAEIYWEFKINGNPWAIEQLATSNGSSDEWQITKKSGEWFLRFPEFSPESAVRLQQLNSGVKGILIKLRDQKEKAKPQAKKILDRLNSILFFIDSSAGKLGLSSICYVDENERMDFLEVIETIEVSDHISFNAFNENGEIIGRQPADRIKDLLRLSEESPDIAEMMSYMQQYGMHDWVNMYKIFELLRKKLGGDNKLIKALSTTKAQKDRFTRTANNPEASGDLARHAVSDQSPPSDPMTLEEGRGYLKTLLLRYFSLNINAVIGPKSSSE